MKVDRYVLPEEFDRWGREAEQMGFLYWASGPLVRSSFKANELMKSALGRRLAAGKGLGKMGKVEQVGAAGERVVLEGVVA